MKSYKRFRIIVSGKQVRAFFRPTKITLNTKCPEKWLFVDLETRDIWKWKNGTFRATDIKLEVLP